MAAAPNAFSTKGAAILGGVVCAAAGLFCSLRAAPGSGDAAVEPPPPQPPPASTTGGHRSCKACGGEQLAATEFSEKQWTKAGTSKGGTCARCAAQLDRAKRALEAAAPAGAPAAWRGRRANCSSRGKAPRHAEMKQGARGWSLVVAENVDDYRAAIAQEVCCASSLQFEAHTLAPPTCANMRSISEPSLRARISQVQPGDCVLEVGCHEGTTTVLLANAPGVRAAVGVDKGAHVLRVARERHPQLRFVDADVHMAGLAGLATTLHAELRASVDANTQAAADGAATAAGTAVPAGDGGGGAGGGGEALQFQAIFVDIGGKGLNS